MARRVVSDGKTRFGWCMGWDNELNHKECQTEYIANTQSANHSIGDVVRCMCECHEK